MLCYLQGRADGEEGCKMLLGATGIALPYPLHLG